VRVTTSGAAAGRALLVAASYVVLRRGDDVLLHLRQNTGYRDGCWGMLAGHVERDESAEQAALREAHEEAGVRISPEGLRPLTTLHRFEIGGPPVEQRCDFFYEVRVWQGTPTIAEPAKCAAMEWFALDRLPPDVVPHERLVLDALRAGYVPPILTVPTPASA
jgi:8-oxo-dGTP pyrophosphatase MutT (NUDIX family)